MPTDFAGILFALLIAHALCDYPLQGDFLAKAKNPAAPIAGVPWWLAMGAHALIHAGGVWVVTGSQTMAFWEFFAHGLIDIQKCEGRISFAVDQALHGACKVLWAALASGGAS